MFYFPEGDEDEKPEGEKTPAEDKTPETPAE